MTTDPDKAAQERRQAAQAMGRAKSPAKTLAARLNGRKGGLARAKKLARRKLARQLQPEDAK